MLRGGGVLLEPVRPRLLRAEDDGPGHLATCRMCFRVRQRKKLVRHEDVDEVIRERREVVCCLRSVDFRPLELCAKSCQQLLEKRVLAAGRDKASTNEHGSAAYRGSAR